MDPVTHILVGAAAAQLPRPATKVQLTPDLSWKKRILIGGMTALFPDIDYLLFAWHPLEFIAHWHRAETHSLLLAPLWAGLLAMIWCRYYRWRQHQLLIFKICLAAILSHAIIDSFTTFGTQWFTPVSDLRVSWDLLFVVDGYFTLTCLITLILLVWWRQHSYRVSALITPLAYLTLVLFLKLTALSQLPTPLLDGSKSSAEPILLPQPFSPLYWQVIQPTAAGFSQAYLKLANDNIGAKFSQYWSGESINNSYRLPQQLSWHNYSVTPGNSAWQPDAAEVWVHQKFRSFVHFARYPVFYDYQKRSNYTCVWFSDLRYHWPNNFPAFRIGMCRKNHRQWQLARIQYFSRDQMEIIR
jgi:inner membrane protein